MRKFAILAIILAILFVVSATHAAEKEISAVLTEDPVVAIDSRGDEYVRLIGKFDRELNGVEYSVTLPIMAFASSGTTETAKAYNKGDTIKAICQNRVLQDGRESFSIVKFLE